MRDRNKIGPKKSLLEEFEIREYLQQQQEGEGFVYYLVFSVIVLIILGVIFL
jgi:hypothetical protein